MKYLVSSAATLSFADGTKVELFPGIHDSQIFTDATKKHWAFSAYAKPLDETDLLKEQEVNNQLQRLAELEEDNTSLKAQLESRDELVGNLTNEVIALKAELVSRDETVTSLTAEVQTLKAQLVEKDSVIDELNSAKDQKNGKKQ